jgi:hypothetical protein
MASPRWLPRFWHSLARIFTLSHEISFTHEQVAKYYIHMHNGLPDGHSPIGAGEVVVVDGRDGPFGLRRPGSGQDGENGALGW